MLGYVLAYRTGRDNGRDYQLLYDGHTHEAPMWQLGLSDVEGLRSQGTKQGRRDACGTMQGFRHTQLEIVRLARRLSAMPPQRMAEK